MMAVDSVEHGPFCALAPTPPPCFDLWASRRALWEKLTIREKSLSGFLSSHSENTVNHVSHLNLTQCVRFCFKNARSCITVRTGARVTEGNP